MQTLTDKKRIKLATVYKILQIWNIGGLSATKIFLDDEETVVYKNSWGDKIKKNLNGGHYKSVQMEIENLILKFKISEYEFISDKTKGFNYDSSRGGWS